MMVKLNWTWKDYERCKRQEERKAAKRASGSRPSKEVAKSEVAPQIVVPEKTDPTPRRNATPFLPASVDVVPVQVEPVSPCQPESDKPMRFCKVCGKHVLATCLYGGCPIQ